MTSRPKPESDDCCPSDVVVCVALPTDRRAMDRCLAPQTRGKHDFVPSVVRRSPNRDAAWAYYEPFVARVTRTAMNRLSGLGARVVADATMRDVSFALQSSTVVVLVA